MRSAKGRRPTGMAEDEEIVYDFLTEALQHKGASDATYARTVAKFGEQGLIDLIRHRRLLHAARDGHERRADGRAGRTGAAAAGAPAQSEAALKNK